MSIPLDDAILELEQDTNTATGGRWRLTKLELQDDGLYRATMTDGRWRSTGRSRSAGTAAALAGVAALAHKLEEPT